jgi:cytochrome c oxidase subunit 2
MFRKPIFFICAALALGTLACGLSAGTRSEAQSPETAPISGEQVFQRLGCAECHTGPAGIAPRLEGVYGEEVALESGETVTADEEYLRESILSPREKIVLGYQPIMPDYQDKVTDEELEALVGYIRSLGE